MRYGTWPLVLFLASLQLAVASLRVEHREANRAALNFLEKVPMFARGEKSGSAGGVLDLTLVDLVRSEGATAFIALVTAAAGGLPTSRVDDSGGNIANAMYQIWRLTPETSPVCQPISG